MREETDEIINDLYINKINGEQALSKLLILHNVIGSQELPVTVLSNDNYSAKYAEDTPFKAVIYEVTDYPCFWVKSLVTGKKYELYDFHIKELHNEENDLL